MTVLSETVLLIFKIFKTKLLVTNTWEVYKQNEYK